MEKGERAGKEDHKEGTQLSMRSLFFLSIGGQGPFISLVAFGSEMVALSGLLSPISMALATLLVLTNGVVINSLSHRFSKGSGYYTYGFYGLSERIGFSTGWMYIAYSIAYGGTIMLGSAYIIRLVTGLPDWVSVLLIVSISGFFVIRGTKTSAKFAEVFGLIELLVVLALGIFFLYQSGFRIYDPVTGLKPQDLGSVWLGALYGLGIPTGYGAITPLTGEAKDAKRTIGRTAILAILTGGILATFLFYALADYGYTGSIPELLVTEFGVIGRVFLSVVAVTDGILGGISFMIAGSKVMFSMAKDGRLPKIFSRESSGGSTLSDSAIVLIVALVLLYMSLRGGSLEGIVILGALSGLFNLFVHESANFSLVRLAVLGIIRRTTSRLKSRLPEVVLSLVAVLFSGYLLITSLQQVSKTIVLIFFSWMVLSFFYLETLEIVRQTKEE